MTHRKAWPSAGSAEQGNPLAEIITAPPETWHDQLEFLVATRYCALTRAGYSIKDALALASHTERLLPDEVQRALREEAAGSALTDHETTPPEPQAKREPRTGILPATAAA